VVGYVDRPTLLLWMLVNRRFYLHFGPAILLCACTFTRKGLKLMINSPSIRVLSSRFKPIDLFVRQVDEDPQARLDYFKEKKQQFMPSSKILQIQNDAVCIIGGMKKYPSLVAHEYDETRACLHINLCSGILTVKAQMSVGRSLFGLGLIHNFIFVVAGVDSSRRKIEKSCE
jgi:hypothetical protein